MATIEGTERYHKSIASPGNAVKTLGSTNLKVSTLGFGGYRIHHGSKEHREGLTHALLNGINLIDTSSNYTDGGSEMLVGMVLHDLTQKNSILRDEIVVVSKAGYAQGQNLKLVQQRASAGDPYQDMVTYAEGCWHCIHPDFLEDQLRLSLGRLRLDCIDIYLLHNPEYFLVDAQKRGEHEIEEAREEYYNRIKLAFEWMEEKVHSGKINWYGISSNSFPSVPEDYEFTSLERILDVAKSISNDHHFRVIQFPFNIYERGAAIEKNQKNGTKTLLEIAEDYGLATLVNRPLNAMTNGKLVRLTSFRESDPEEIQREFMKHHTLIAALEDEFFAQHAEKLPASISRETLENIFSHGEYLKNGLVMFRNWGHWDHIKQNIIMPHVCSAISQFSTEKKEDNAWKVWVESYSNTLRQLLDTISKQYENLENVRSESVMKKLDDNSDMFRSSKSLCQKALRLLCSTKGIHCVLVGMRKKPYVDDALAAIKEPAIQDAVKILESLDL